jgi:hypothetical protein
MLDAHRQCACISLMKIKLFALLLVAVLAGIATGCVETVNGHSEAGVPFLKDTIDSSYERSVPQVIAAARAVIKFNGQLTGDNTVNNSLEGKVNQCTVFVRVDEVDAAKPISRVFVQARTRAGGRNIDLAAEIQKQIALQLAAH